MHVIDGNDKGLDKAEMPDGSSREWNHSFGCRRYE
jgi:hypothetical protein